MKIRDQYTCPLELAHDMIRGKWKLIIIWEISYGPISLTNLERNIEGITQKMLIEHLNDLVSNGFVSREKHDGYPLSVKYSLTEPQGKELFEATKMLQKIGIRYMREHGNGEAYFARIEQRTKSGETVHMPPGDLV